jgi:iron complex transport system substrate-binding protein
LPPVRAVRSSRLLLLLAALLGAPAGAAPAERIVSLNPSLTAIVLALGARSALVGVDDFSARQHPEAAGLPTVGGLYDPSLESVVALAPDLVVFVRGAEQRDFAERLEDLGVAVESFENTRLDDVLGNVTRLGALTGRERAAQERVAAVHRAREQAVRAAAGRPRPRTVLVLQRDPLYLVGRGSFLDELLAAAGAENLGARFDQPWPRVSAEWLVASGPELVLDASPDPSPPDEYFARWPSLPAVAAGRVVRVDPGVVTLPGPYLDRALQVLAAAVQGGPSSAPGVEPAP